MNRKMIIFVFVMFFLIGNVSAFSFFGIGSNNIGSSSLNKELIAHWPLGGESYNSNTARVTDKTPYENYGVNSGAGLIEGRHGESNKAMEFYGASDYIKIDNVVVTDPTELTIAGWIKKEGAGSTYETALHHGSDTTIGNSAYWFGVDSSDYLTATIGARTGVGWSAGKTTTLAIYGEWYHLAASWDGSVVRVYINGEYDKQYNLASYSSLETSTRIGASSDGSTYQFNGSIQDVKIYNRGLSASEIKSLYDSTSSKVSSGSINKGLILDMPLKSRYTKSETVGSETMTDRTPYGRDGTNHNGVVGSSSTYFDGNDWIGEIEGTNYVEPEAITVSSWINLATDAPTARNIWLTKWYGFSMEIQDTTRIPYFRLNGPGDTVSNTSLTLGQWHHFVGTYDSSIGGRVYLDGNLVGTKATSTAITYTENYPLNIGRYYGGIYFKGNISDVKIYDRALTASEVESLYDRRRY